MLHQIAKNQSTFAALVKSQHSVQQVLSFVQNVEPYHSIIVSCHVTDPSNVPIMHTHSFTTFNITHV